MTRKLLALALLLTSCSALTHRVDYEMGLTEVQRPPSAIRKYGPPTLKVQPQQFPSTSEYAISTHGVKGVKRGTSFNDLYLYDDALIHAAWTIAPDSLGVTLTNKSRTQIGVVWDRAAYLDLDGVSHPVIHRGIKLAARNEPPRATVLAAGAVLEDEVLPLDYIRWAASDWTVSNLFPAPTMVNAASDDAKRVQALKGRKIGVLLPLAVGGETVDYLFSFAFTDVKLTAK